MLMGWWIAVVGAVVTHPDTAAASITI